MKTTIQLFAVKYIWMFACLTACVGRVPRERHCEDCEQQPVCDRSDPTCEIQDAGLGDGDADADADADSDADADGDADSNDGCLVNETICMAGCVNLMSDYDNCGACAVHCGRGPNAAGACVRGVCACDIPADINEDPLVCGAGLGVCMRPEGSTFGDGQGYCG